MEFCLNNGPGYKKPSFTTTFNNNGGAVPFVFYTWPSHNGAAANPVDVKCLCLKCQGGEATPEAGA